MLALLRGLTAAQWEAPSLCTEWRVRHVATHIVSYGELSTPNLVATFVRGGLRVSGVNDVALKRYESIGPEAIIDLVSRNLRPRGLTSGFGGGIALTDGTLHHLNIGRALGLPPDDSAQTARAGPRLRVPCSDPDRQEERERSEAGRNGHGLDPG